jgi:hypothetical protein
MPGFQSFRNAVLEDEVLQEQAIFIVNTTTANGSDLGEGIMNRPHLARHFSAIQNGNRRSEYEQQTIYRRI